MALLATTFASLVLAAPSPASRCDRLYVFGDSYSDSGQGYLDGNGPTAVVYTAHALGLSLLPADLGAAGDSLNFAISGAKTGSSKGVTRGKAVLGVGMAEQVEAFEARLKAGTARFEPATAVFFLAGGLNDRTLSTEQSIQNIRDRAHRLYALGARRLVLAQIPQTLINPEVGPRLNPEIGKLVTRLQGELPDADVRLSAWGLWFDQIRREGAARGFQEMTRACAGRAILGQDPTPCANPTASFYYHADHPSTEVHRQVGQLLFEEARRSWCPIS